MKKPILFLAVAIGLLALVLGLWLLRPPNLSSSDPVVAKLESDQKELVGYAAESRTKVAEAERVHAALWTPAAVATLLQELPKGWTAQKISTEKKATVQLCRYAFSKDAAQLRDYPEFLRVLKKLEERPSTRIEAVNLVLNPDGQRFATALITTTLPLPFTPNQHEP